MNINAKTTALIFELEIQHKIEENRLLILALSFLSEKATAIRTILDQLNFPDEELFSMLKLLQENEIISKNDLDLVKRVEKTSTSKTLQLQTYDDMIEEIINHLYVISGKTRSRVTEKKKKLVEKWLRKGHTVEDFIKVNIFFNEEWSNNPSMEPYIRPETLYNGKFEERLEMAESNMRQVEKFHREISYICQEYYEACVELIQEPNEEYLKKGRFTTPCSLVPLKVQKQIAFWLRKGYPIEDIVLTLRETILSWSRREDILPHISLEKIMDPKFPERVTSAKKIIENRMSTKGNRVIDDWLNDKKQNIEAAIISDKPVPVTPGTSITSLLEG